MTIDTIEQLEERLSRPSEADVLAMAALEGELLILGVGGKMGPSLARLARRAADKAGSPKRILAVSRFSEPGLREQLESIRIETIACDLLEPGALAALPDVPNVIFLAARKFGTTGAEHLSWASNTYLPGLTAERFRASRIVTFSSGNVYPLRRVAEGGALETTTPEPAGEYAQSVLGRERMFEYASARYGTEVAILRLNYAVELRYGVLVDIGRSVFEQRPIDLCTGFVNVIWQGDANSVCLRSLAHCAAPPFVFNVTGPETLSVRDLARQFGERFGIQPAFAGTEADSALLSDAGKAHGLFGYPSVGIRELMDWTARWIEIGGKTHNKPTHFQVRDGKF
jgi:nucleoside-diphosphate-sugar epimerase